MHLEPSNKDRVVDDWMSPINFLQRQKDVYEPHYSGSRDRILESRQFQRWFQGESQILWCQGIRMTILEKSDWP